MNAGPIFVLIALVCAMAILSPYFLTGLNIRNLAAQTSIVAALAVGQLIVIVSRGIDLSVGSTIGLVGVVGATAATWDWMSGGFVLLLMLLVGVVVGFGNGLLIVKGGLPQPLIVTVATLGVIRGLALVVTDGEVLITVPDLVLTLGGDYIGPVPVPALVVGMGAGVTWIFMAKTQWGRWFYVVGGDPEAARRLGLPTDRVLMSAYVLCALWAAVAGVLLAGRTGTGSPTAGTLLELDAITAVIIGGASLIGGRGNVGHVLIGALVVGTIRNGMDLLGVAPFWQTIAVGAVVLAALELDVLRRKLEERLRVSRAHVAPASLRGGAHAA